MMMNKEVWMEGYLIKSPPTKRIWRARWRRRWFTLKQGELPGQFFLEYYTDRKCRKLKGIIDLDQCEQVDAGLTLVREKHKFQNMFNVKTPRRTYYLAADSEDDMRAWVNCICQVCNLQETKSTDDRQYYNIGPDAINSAPIENDVSNETETTLLNNSVIVTSEMPSTSASTNQMYGMQHNSIYNMANNNYQNDDILANYSNRETIICDTKLTQNQKNNNVVVLNRNEHFEAYSNISTIERSQSLRGKPESSLISHSRTLSLNESSKAHTGTVKKIPENLKLTDKIANFVENHGEQPSPALSTSSGPYIPISECYSGSSPVLLNDQHTPATPLNSLDPRFYDTPRSHTNIGFNLTNNEQPYSPKRNNFIGSQQMQKTMHSGKSSPSDSESVFTDDEWTQPVMPQNTLERKPGDRPALPSDSSIENDAIGWTYVQRFAKIPADSNKNTAEYENTPDEIIAPPRPPKKTFSVIEGIEKTKENQSSDTENASPAIGPRDGSSYVEQCYDIPRSHQLPFSCSNSNLSVDADFMAPIKHCDLVASSTPNLISDITNLGTLGKRPHCYTNAAPTKVEGNVFRYDFIEQGDAPAINRNLKPKSSLDLAKSIDSIGDSVKQMNMSGLPTTPIIPPNIDRKLKPSTPKFGTNSMRRKGGPVSLQLNENEYGNVKNDNQHFGQQFISPKTPNKSEDRLQYLDLDHSNSPQKSTSNTSGSMSTANQSGMTNSNLTNINRKDKDGPGVSYITVDFVKTDALNRVREDSEHERAKSMK